MQQTRTGWGGVPHCTTRNTQGKPPTQEGKRTGSCFSPREFFQGIQQHELEDHRLLDFWPPRHDLVYQFGVLCYSAPNCIQAPKLASVIPSRVLKSITHYHSWSCNNWCCHVASPQGPFQRESPCGPTKSTPKGCHMCRSQIVNA